jgi:hypothetical protein
VGHLLCLLTPGSCISTSIAKATLGDLFNALTGWVLSSVQWLLGVVGQVLTSASEPSTVVRSASQEFDTLLGVAPVLMMAGLLVATLQALRHADGSSLWRVYFGVAPACVLGVALARPAATLVLEAVNQLSSSAAGAMVVHETTLTTAFTALSASTSIPGFGLFLLALGVVIGGWLLWCELVLRTVVLTLLLVLVPVVVPLSTFPPLRRLGWRLAETFTAVAASKFLIVVALSLGLDELQGTSASEVVIGAVTIALATCTPYLLLRMIPFVEQSALHNLEGVRQRFARSVQSAPSSPAAVAVRSLLPDVPVPGPTGRAEDLGLSMWDSTADIDFPEPGGEPGPAPIGEPRVRGGHVAYHSDELGPVVGWHFDE